MGCNNMKIKKKGGGAGEKGRPTDLPTCIASKSYLVACDEKKGKNDE